MERYSCASSGEALNLRYLFIGSHNMNESLSAYIPIVPDVTKPFFAWATALLLTLWLIFQGARKFREFIHEFREPIDYLMHRAKMLNRHVLRTIRVTGVKKRPRLVLVLNAFMAGIWIVFSTQFLILEILILGLLYTHPALPLVGFYMCLATVVICQLACFYYWGLAQRDRISLNRRWRKLTGSNWFW